MIKNVRNKKINKIINYLGRKKIFFFFFYLLFSIVILRGIIFSHGRIIGNDWGGLPSTISDIGNTFTEYQYTWSNTGNALGVLNFAQNSLLTMSVMKLFSLFQIDGVAFIKIFLVLVFTMAGYFMFSLLKSFKLINAAALVGGIIYITTPLFFNYTIMGWTYVLLFMAMLPLGVQYFVKANETDDWRYLIFVALIFEIMLLQSQAILWFPIVLLFLSVYLVSNKKTLLIYFKSALILFLLTFILNLWWAMTTFFVKSTAVFSGDTLMTSGSLGASAMLVPLNIIRLYGSLYNNQFEYIIKSYGLSIFAFIIPVLVVCSFLLKDKKRQTITFFLISTIPLLFYFLNFHRELLLAVPLINIVRDFGRFSVLSAFALPVVASFVLDYLYLNKIKKGRVLFYFVIFLFIIFIYPWYGNFLTSYQMGIAEHQRIRTKEFPQEYYDISYALNNKKIDSKGLFLPSAVIGEFSDDDRFKGLFQEFYDTFFSYSKFHGWYPTNSNNTGFGDYLSKQLLAKNINTNYENFLKLTDVSDIIIRNNMVMRSSEKMTKALDGDTNLLKHVNSEKITAYRRKGENFLPHFYVPLKIIQSDQSVESLPDIVSAPDYSLRSAVYLLNQNKNKESLISALPKNLVSSSSLEFKKINLTKYRVIFHHAKEEMPLVFLESFHDGWKLYNVKHENNLLETNPNELVNKYKILDGNNEDQASTEELKDFVSKGIVSTLGDGKSKSTYHKKWKNGKEELDYIEKYDIDFISKNFQGTIQNNNLPDGKIWETWFVSKSGKKESKTIQLPDSNHLVANGYANSWIIKPEEICRDNNNCVKNLDGTYDFELVVDFWPQRLFYLGLLISGGALVGCIIYLLFRSRRVRRIKSKANNE